MFESGKELGKKILKTTFDNLDDLLIEIPVVGSLAGKIYKIAYQSVNEYNEEQKQEQTAKQEAEKSEKPLYMDSVSFRCVNGHTLSERQINTIALFFDEDWDCDEKEVLDTDLDVENYNILINFINQYMGGMVSMDNVDDSELGENYVNFNFYIENEEYHLYNEEVLNQVMGALNKLLREPVFDFYIVGAHND